MAYNFQASGDTITLGNTVLPASLSAYSFVAWINTDVADNSARQIISLNDGASDNRDMWLEFATGATNQIAFGFFDTGGGFPQATWTSGFSASTWHFIAGTWNGTIQSIFADTDSTAKATNTPGNGPNTVAADGFIGNRTGGGRPANGYIAEVAFYNRAVSGAELASMGAGYSPLFFPNGLVDYWPLVRTTINPKSGRNGTASGAVVAAHPKIIYPSPQQIRRFTTQVAPAGTSPKFYRAMMGVGF